MLGQIYGFPGRLAAVYKLLGAGYRCIFIENSSAIQNITGKKLGIYFKKMLANKILTAQIYV